MKLSCTRTYCLKSICASLPRACGTLHALPIEDYLFRIKTFSRMTTCHGHVKQHHAGIMNLPVTQAGARYRSLGSHGTLPLWCLYLKEAKRPKKRASKVHPEDDAQWVRTANLQNQTETRLHNGMCVARGVLTKPTPVSAAKNCFSTI